MDYVEKLDKQAADTQAALNELNIKRPPGWQGPKGLDKDKILELRSKGLSMAEIGKLLNCRKEAIFYHLHNMDVEQEQIDEYKRNRADYLAGIQLRLLASLSPDDVRKMQPGSRILGACQLFDKERLERGLATSHEKMIVLQVPRSEEEYKKIMENQKVVNPENEENTV